MKKIIASTFFIIAFIFDINAQVIEFDDIKDRIINLGEVTNNNEEFSTFSGLKDVLKDVEIIMLGEQSHREGTAYETKVKLIKYLHQELGFDILAFESGFYDCHKASQLINQGEDVRDAIGGSVFHLWSTVKELKPLVQYIEDSNNTDKKLKLFGFDSQFSGGSLPEKYFIQDLSAYLSTINPSITKTEDWSHLEQNIDYLMKYEFKKAKKNYPKKDALFLNHLIKTIQEAPKDSLSIFWIQNLKNVKVFLSDMTLKTYGRDKQMADNLIWIKEKYPKSKIICWGATSHFLYNSTEVRMRSPFIQLLAGKDYKKYIMMGTYIKDLYKEKVYTIGFTAYQGEASLVGLGRKKIRAAKKRTLEHLLNQSKFDNFLLPLKDLDLSEYRSRPLGNYYMRNDISRVMDAVIFNKTMRGATFDRNFFLKMYPGNKYIQPEEENWDLSFPDGLQETEN